MCCFITGKSIFSVITSFCHVPSLHHLLWIIYVCLLLCPSPALLSLHDLVLNESFSAILLTCPIPALLTLLVLQQSLRAVGFAERWSSGFGISDAARMWWCGWPVRCCGGGGLCSCSLPLGDPGVLHCWWWKSRPINGTVRFSAL